jgi:TetR/AcrR family transcriptional regulator, mexJK operon transcriptional repressor
MSNGAETRMRRSRQKILTAAEPIFLRKGFLGTNMDEVAEVADVSKQTVYSHFGSKEGLFMEIVEAMTGAANSELKPTVEDLPDDRPIEEFLMDFATQQLTIVLTPRLMQLRRLVIGEVERFPKLGRALYENGPMRSIELLTTVFETYAGRGELLISDPVEAATFFNWILMGAPTNEAMLLGDAKIPTKEQLRKHAAESVRIFLSAYSPSKQGER